MGEAAIRTDGLTKRYGSVPALQNLSIEVASGEVLGYLGPNGAGKTTTIRLLLALARPTSGSAEIFGIDCTRRPVEAHEHLTYVPGEADLWPSLTGAETLHLLGRIHGHVDETYRDQLVTRFELDVDKKVRAYSKGNRQKVLLIGALMCRPDLLILDEPTSGLDPLMEHQFRLAVSEAKHRGQTVFLSSHLLSEVEAVCNRVAILRDGLLVEVGSLDDMRHLSTTLVQVRFSGTVPDLTRVPGVRSLRVNGTLAQLEVTGSMDPLVKALASSEIIELKSREPSLEELFLSLYGEAPLHPPDV
ncbi:MAG TPA: ABC transporter ATP-binding protein [Acidimicrobiales bacterium]|nr:ABC transporter ATP-binding protein [Acidimicrobiales bacterium]